MRERMMLVAVAIAVGVAALVGQAPGLFSDLDIDGDLYIAQDDQILARHLNTGTGTSTGVGQRTVAVQPLSWWPALSGDPICSLIGSVGGWYIAENPANVYGEFALPAAVDAVRGITASGSDLWIVDDNFRNYESGSLWRSPLSNPTAGTEVTLPEPLGAQGLAVDDPYLWIVDGSGTASIWRVSLAIRDRVRYALPSGLGRPEGITVVGSDLWIADASTGAGGVWRVPQSNPTTGTEFRFVNPIRPIGVTVSGSDLWVAFAQERVERHPLSDPTTATVLFLPSEFDGPPNGIAAAGSDLWVLDGRRSLWRVTQSDPSTGTEYALPSGLDDPEGITVVGSDLWIVDDDIPDSVWRVPTSNPTTGTEFALPISGQATSAPLTGIAAAGSDFWITDNSPSNPAVWRVPMELPTEFALPAGLDNPTGVTVAGSNFWITDSASVWRVPQSDTTTGTEFLLPSGVSPTGVTAAGLNLFVATASSVWRVLQSDPSTGMMFALPSGLATGVTASGPDLWILDDATPDSVWRVPQINPAAMTCAGQTTLEWTYMTDSDHPAIRVRRTTTGEVVAIWSQEDPPASMPISIPAWETTTDTLASPPVPSLALLGSLYAGAPPGTRQDALTALRGYVTGRGWLGALNAVSGLSGVPASCPAAPQASCEPMARYVALRELASAGDELVFNLVARELRVSADGAWSLAP